MSEKNNTHTSDKRRCPAIFRIFKFVFISYALSVLLIALLSLLVVYTPLPEAISTPAVKCITFFTSLFSAFLTARSIKSRGWLTGAMVGGFNICILISLGALIYGFSPFTSSNLVSVILGIFLGMAGGIVGINSKKQTDS